MNNLQNEETNKQKLSLENVSITLKEKSKILKQKEVYDDIDELINLLTQLSIEGQSVFRGYNKKQEMLPKIIRNENFTDIEINLLRNFEKYGLQYINVIDEMDFMSYAQHFGLSTRLLDFTYNPFIALYFALYNEKLEDVKYEEDEDFKYYYVQQCNIKEQICINSLPKYIGMHFGGFEVISMANTCKKMFDRLTNIYNQKPNTEEVLKAIYTDLVNKETDQNTFVQSLFDKFKDKKLLFIDANQSNQRLVMQQGLFLMPYVLEKEEFIKSISDNTKVIKINKNLRTGLINYLNTIGINAYRLMPDLMNVCAAVERETKNARI